MKYPISILLFLLAACFGSVLHVPYDCPTIQLAINTATVGDTVMLAAGTYSPSTNNEVFPIEILNSIHLVGAGEELTFIDAEQSESVIILDNCENNTISNLTIRNGLGVNGGGMILFNSNSILKHLTITNNTSYNNGGGIYLVDSSPLLSHITVSHNTSNNGGGLYIRSSNPILNHLTISNNVSEEGQGVMLYNSDCTLTNSIVYNNTHCHDGWCHDSIYLLGDANQTTVTYNNIEGGWLGIGNIDSAPLFINPDDSDYNLMEESPCIDVGLVLEDIEYFGLAPDMGAYEYIDGTHDLLGDLNGDEIVNILDVVLLVDFLLISGDFNQLADLNDDGLNNIIDVVALVNLVLNI